MKAAEPTVISPVAVSTMAGERSMAGDADIRANRRRVQMLLALAGGVPGIVVGVLVGLLAGAAAGAVAGAAVAVAVAAVSWRGATGLVLRLIGGRAVDPDDEPELAGLVDGLCATFGVPLPGLWLLDDPVPNACALGRRPDGALLVVTSGLLDLLGLVEAEGVVAHELVHVKRHDTAVSALAVAVLYPLVRLTGSDRAVHAVLGRGREYRADREAVTTVRYPPGLCAALGTFARSPAPSPTSVFAGRRWAATRWLWIDPMVGTRGAPLEGEIDATAVRAAVLAEY